MKGIFRIKDIIGFIILCILMLYIVFIINDMFTYPLESLRIPSYAILSVLFIIFINLSILILRYFTSFMKKGYKFYSLLCVLSIFLPIFIISNIEGVIKDKILLSVQQKMSPIIKHIDNNDNLSGFNTDKLNNMHYYRGINIYMLTTTVPSIDIDGETIFYDSKTEKWYRFHNDMYDYYKDKKEIPNNIKRYIWLIKNTKLIKKFL